MAATILPLFEPSLIPATPAINFFTATLPTQVTKMTVVNTSLTTAYSVSIYWVPASGAPSDATNQMVNARLIAAKESWDAWPFIGHVLARGDSIWAVADIASKLIFAASGLAVSG